MLMASLVTKRRYLLVILIVCIVVFSCTSGENDYEPEIGAIGNHPSREEGGDDHGHEGEGDGEGEYQGHEGGAGDGGHDIGGEDHGHEDGDEERGHEGGDEEHGHGHDHDGSLLCFHEKHIYSSCDESCRLSAHGDIHVSHDQVDEFCNGPCLEETNLVLECLEGIMDNFLFYNQATTRDVRNTILAGCGDGDHRGDFNVGEHIEDDEGGGSIRSAPKFPFLSVTMIIIVVWQILAL